MCKIIQIAAVPDTKDSAGALYALCDDGTVWIRIDSFEPPKWVRIEPIPAQDDAQPFYTRKEMREACLNNYRAGFDAGSQQSGKGK